MVESSDFTGQEPGLKSPWPWDGLSQQWIYGYVRALDFTFCLRRRRGPSLHSEQRLHTCIDAGKEVALNRSHTCM